LQEGVWGDFHVKRLGIPIVTFKGEKKVDIGLIMGVQDKTPPFLDVKTSLRVALEEKT